MKTIDMVWKFRKIVHNCYIFTNEDLGETMYIPIKSNIKATEEYYKEIFELYSQRLNSIRINAKEPKCGKLH